MFFDFRQEVFLARIRIQEAQLAGRPRDAVEAVAEEEAAEALVSPLTAARILPPGVAVAAVPANEAENEEKSLWLFAFFTPFYAFHYRSDAVEKNVVVFDTF